VKLNADGSSRTYSSFVVYVAMPDLFAPYWCVQVKAGEVQQYTHVVEQARHHALQRLVEHARAQGANAVIGVRFDSSEIGQQLSEIVAYGTAVVIVSDS
jgi:uncharacterized protein YbjQ (UPF0145 family)